MNGSGVPLFLDESPLNSDPFRTMIPTVIHYATPARGIMGLIALQGRSPWPEDLNSRVRCCFVTLFHSRAGNIYIYIERHTYLQYMSVLFVWEREIEREREREVKR
jgi:hypothetical protein